MSHYTEVPVVLRFRSQAPLSVDDVSHRLQTSRIDELAEFVIVEQPKAASHQGWTAMHKQMEMLNQAWPGPTRPINAPLESSPYQA